VKLQVPIALAKEFYELNPSLRAEIVRNFRITSSSGGSSSTYVGEVAAKGVSHELIEWFESNSQLLGPDFEVYSDSLTIEDDLNYDARLAEYESLSRKKRNDLRIAGYALAVGALLTVSAVVFSFWMFETVKLSVVEGTKVNVDPARTFVTIALGYSCRLAFLISGFSYARAKNLSIALVMILSILHPLTSIAVAIGTPFWPDRNCLIEPTKPEDYDLLKHIRSALAEQMKIHGSEKLKFDTTTFAEVKARPDLDSNVPVNLDNEPIILDAEPQGKTLQPDSKDSELARLYALYRSGAITEAEFIELRNL
jgi:hypothetical protein